MMNPISLERRQTTLPTLRLFSLILIVALLIIPVGAFAAPEDAGGHHTIRFATFNASLNRNFAGQLVANLSTPNNMQAKTVAEIIQRTRPDVLLINEFDFVEAGVAAELFQANYLSVSQNGAEPIEYGYYFVAPSNLAQLFSDLGLSVADLQRMAPSEAFGKIGDAIGKMEDPMASLTATVQVFGKSGFYIARLMGTTTEAVAEAAAGPADSA